MPTVDGEESTGRFPEAIWLLAAHSTLKQQVINLDGVTLEVGPQVLSPALTSTSSFFLKHLRHLITGGSVFEVGVGSGYLVVGLGMDNPRLRLAGSDINPSAVQLARRNLAMNMVDAQVYHADLFDGLPPGYLYDTVIFNPPLLHANPQTDLERALYDPGGATFRRFLEALPARLNAAGCAYVLYSDRNFGSYSAHDFLMELTDRLAITTSREAVLDRIFEVYTLWKLTV